MRFLVVHAYGSTTAAAAAAVAFVQHVSPVLDAVSVVVVVVVAAAAAAVDGASDVLGNALKPFRIQLPSLIRFCSFSGYLRSNGSYPCNHKNRMTIHHNPNKCPYCGDDLFLAFAVDPSDVVHSTRLVTQRGGYTMRLLTYLVLSVISGYR